MTNIVSRVSQKVIAVVDGSAQSVETFTILVNGVLIEFDTPIVCEDLEKLNSQGELANAVQQFRG